MHIPHFGWLLAFNTLIIATGLVTVYVFQRQRFKRNLENMGTSLDEILKGQTEEIKKSEERFRSIVESPLAGIFIINDKFSIVYCNSYCAQLLKSTPRKVVGTDFRTILTQSSLNLVVERYQKRQRGEEVPEQYEIEVVATNGEVRKVEINASVLRSGDKIETICQMRDVTEKEKISKELEEQQSKVIQASKFSTLGEMASGIAHEINNPLTIILGFTTKLSRLAENESLDKDTAKKIGSKINEMITRIAKIIKGLRALSRDSSNDPMEPVSVNDVINDGLYLCHQKFKFQGIELRVDHIPSDLYILGRQVEITQVLLHILSNAYDATQELEDRWISVNVNESDNNSITIAITDSGKALDKEMIEKALNPFFTTKDIGKGTGLGLSISRGIIENHGGSLKFDTDSENTKVIINLQKANEEQVNDYLKKLEDQKEEDPFNLSH